MKIGIDISQTVYKGTGVARYTTNLIKGLIEHDKKNDYVFFFSSLRQSIPNDLKQALRGEVVKKFNLPPSLLNILWNNFHIAPIEKFIGSVDVFYSSDWAEPPVKHAKKLTTIHDLVPYKFPETSAHKTTFNLKTFTLGQNIVSTHKNRLKWVKKEDELVSCNSETTAVDVEQILRIKKNKLRVIYPGVDIALPTREKNLSLLKKYKIERPFILTIGTLQPRKNIKRLIEAFTALNIKDLDLYIIGLQGWGEELHNNNTHIRFLGYIPDEDLSFFYQQTLFFIYPALYEGFGYPIAEAMTLGCPVATSNTSSLKELADGYGYLFDPYSVENIANAIYTLYKDSKLRNTLSEKGLKRSKDFTVEKFAKGFIEVFKELQ